MEKKEAYGEKYSSSVLSYNFNGVDYKYDTDKYIINNPQKVGDIVEIMIDQDNPEIVFVRQKYDVSLLVFGLLLSIGSVIAIFMI